MGGEDLRILGYGWAGMAAVVWIICVINIVTVTHDHPRLNPLAPVVWEVSSALVTSLLILVPWGLTRWIARARPPRWLAALAVVAAAPPYSLAHVFGFLALRHGAYALAGEHYDYGPLARAIPYEMSKDVLGYGAALLIFWAVGRVRQAMAEAAPAPAPAGDPALFDIRDGARVIRTPVSDILAVTSAGNYVEIWLADGRKPLMRSPLAALERELSAHGLVRTHRSWLVNARRVTGLRPEGSGDYEVELGPLTAPLSRRFPEALARLREG